jgi:ATP-dependent Clp protease protease subunit
MHHNRLQQLLRDNAHTPRRYACQTSADAAERAATIWLYDVIGADAWGGVDAARFAQDVAAISAPVIHLRINSPGGDRPRGDIGFRQGGVRRRWTAAVDAARR